MKGSFSPKKKSSRSLLYLVMLLFMLALPRSVVAGEYELKAAFIYNFLKFVKLPERSPSPHSLVMCILSHDPFFNGLEELRGRIVVDRKIQLITISEFPKPQLCNVLFIHTSYKGDVNGGLEKLRRDGVLSIGEQEGFLDDGGIINFLVEDQRLRFDLDLKNARANGIYPSAQLLKVARTVREDGPDL